jgi:ketosteroid isomerase-like protein
MGASEVDVVRRLYAALLRGEQPEELLHPDFEYVNPPDAVEPGTLRGPDSLWKVRDVYPDFKVTTERIVDVGDRVLVIGVARGTGASGLRTQWRQGYVWTIRDGLAVRFEWFNDPRQALREVGLDELPEA